MPVSIPASASQRAIAEALGLSTATVSRALKNDYGVNKKTRERVLSEAAKLGYKPSPLINAVMRDIRVRSGPSYKETVGFIVTRPAEEMRQMALLKSARRIARQKGIGIDALSLADFSEKPRRIVSLLRARNIRSLILSVPAARKLDGYLDWANHAVVILGSEHLNLGFHQIGFDHQHAARMSYERLAELGYRRIGLVVRERNLLRSDHATLAGCLLARHLDARGEPVTPYRITEWNERDFADWFRRERPDALILDSPRLGVKEALRPEGVRMPRDLALAALNANPADKRTAGVVQPTETMAGMMVETIGILSNALHRGLIEHPQMHLSEGKWRDGPSAPSKSS